jgi:hypothetical protein
VSIRKPGAAAAAARRFAAAWLAIALSGAAPASAHELRPAYLELRETPTGIAALWKTPRIGDARLRLNPVLPDGAKDLAPHRFRLSPGGVIETWEIAPLELRGQTITIGGLDATLTDALLRVAFLDGTSFVRRLTPGAPATTVPERQSAAAVAAVYLELGVRHILEGFDHLLFVAALALATGWGFALLRTVTAFTAAHSLTLALATLGLVQVPQAPVEATIALSIAIVAADLARRGSTRASSPPREPWIVAFVFGLLHGLGFAGALAEIGLPAGNIPLALLFFNLGVEAGQLLFVAVLLLAAAAVHRLREPRPFWTEVLAPYAIGITAMFWVIQRTLAMKG